MSTNFVSDFVFLVLGSFLLAIVCLGPSVVARMLIAGREEGVDVRER